VYLGLDPTSSAEKASGFAILDEAGALLEIGRAYRDEEIIALATKRLTRVVGIDAPLFYPQGWHCLEWPCPEGACPPPQPGALRTAERELYRQGISLYATTKKSLLKLMIHRAIGLKRAFEALGLTVIEVYPYASKVRLFGRPPHKKTTPRGQRWLRQRLEPLIGGLANYPSPLGHDELDALVAAYTAYLYGQGRGEAVGDSVEGEIVLPSTCLP